MNSSNKKNIILLSNSAWSIFHFRIDLIKKLILHEYNVIVISNKDNNFDYLKKLGCKCIQLNIRSHGLNIFIDFLHLLKIIYLLQQYNPLAVLTYTIKPNIYGAIACRITGNKQIANITGIGRSLNANFFIKNLINLLYRHSFKKIFHVFFQNENDKSFFINNRIIKEEQCTRIYGSGINFDIFKKAPLPKNKPFVFLMASRILKDKGVIEFIEAAKQVKMKYPNVIFKLAGDIDNNDKNSIKPKELKDLCSSSGVIFLGHISNIRQEIIESNCIVHPSYYNEGCPRILIESAAIGRILITTDWPGCRDVVKENYNGFLCVPKNIDSLEKVMKKILMLSSNELTNMCNNSNQYAIKYFDVKTINELYFKLIIKK